MSLINFNLVINPHVTKIGVDLGGGCRGFASPPPPGGVLIQLVFGKRKLCAPPSEKNPGSAPVKHSDSVVQE